MNKRVPEVGTPNTRQYNTIQCNTSIKYNNSIIDLDSYNSSISLNKTSYSIVVNLNQLKSASPSSIIDTDPIPDVYSRERKRQSSRMEYLPTTVPLLDRLPG